MSNKDTCPNCGYCKHCGRGGSYFRPYYPWPVPWIGSPQYLRWGTTTGGTYFDTGTYTVDSGAAGGLNNHTSISLTIGGN